MILNFHEKYSQTPDNKNVIEEETNKEEIVEGQCRPFDDDIYDRHPPRDTPVSKHSQG